VVVRLLKRWGLDDRDSWLRAGMVLHHQYEGGDEGLALWDKVSMEFENYTPEGCRDAWDSFGEGGRDPDDVLTARSLIEEGKVDVDDVLQEIESGTVDVPGIVWDIDMLPPVDRDVCRKALIKVTGADARVINDLLKDLKKLKKAEHSIDHRMMALEVIKTHGDDLLNIGGVLYHYTGVYWERLDEGDRVLLVRDIVNNIPKIKIQDGMYRAVGNMVCDLLRNGVDPKRWKWNRLEPDAVAVENGVVVPPGRLRKHRKGDYINAVMPFRWKGLEVGDVLGIEDKFLADIMSGDADRVRLLWQIIGYCMMTNAYREKFFVFEGSGANGKSVLTNLISELLPGRVCSVQPDKLHDVKRIEALEGMLVNITQEMPPGLMVDDAELKSVTSGDTVEIRRHNQQSTFVRLFAKLIMCTNSLPQVRDVSDGLFRRAVVVNFGEKFEGDRCDQHLIDKLVVSEVLDRVAVKALTAYWAIGKNWEIPKACLILRDAWKVDNNPFLGFMRDCVEVTGDDRNKLVYGTLYNGYLRWHRDQGLHPRAVLRKGQFGARLDQLEGVKRRRGAEHRLTVYGLIFEGIEDLD
jgi:putative DNA primase/helicase